MVRGADVVALVDELEAVLTAVTVPVEDPPSVAVVAVVASLVATGSTRSRDWLGSLRYKYLVCDGNETVAVFVHTSPYTASVCATVSAFPANE